MNVETEDSTYKPKGLKIFVTHIMRLSRERKSSQNSLKMAYESRKKKLAWSF